MRISDHVAQRTEAQLRVHFHKYLYYLKGQRYLHSADTEVRMLTKAFQNLPNLTAIQFVASPGEHVPLDPDDADPWRRIAKHNEVEELDPLPE